MGMLFSVLLVTLAGLFTIPVIVFCIEILAAMILPQQEFSLVERRRIAVLVPAHNESKGMLGTLDDIKAQLYSGDRLLVVADNCTDDTAAVAKLAGAEVTERHDLRESARAMPWTGVFSTSASIRLRSSSLSMPTAGWRRILSIGS